MFRRGLYQRYVSSFKSKSKSKSKSKTTSKSKTKSTSDPTATGEVSFAWWDHKYLPLLDSLDRAASILEIGCGSGALLAYLERRGFSHARGVDISAEQIQLARARGVRAEVGDAFDFLAGQREAFAAILAVDVLEHLTRDELVSLAPQLHAALQPGGRLLVQTANGAGLFPRQVIYGDLTHMTIFTPQSLGQLLRPAGFGNLSYYETGPIPIRVRGRIDAALWATIKTLANVVRRVETGKTQAIWTENFICVAVKPA